MRDFLTFVGGFVILILAAALIVPSVIDWETRRGLIEDALGQAIGARVETAGGVSVRLLPTPRLSIERMRVKSSVEGAETALLAAEKVDAEVALTPLLHGTVRFLEARADRLEFWVRTSAQGGNIFQALEAFPLSGQGRLREWTIENLAVDQLFLTTEDAATGQISQIGAQSVVISGQRLTGPWAIQGVRNDVPFRLVTGELSAAKTLAVKLSTGTEFRLEAEGLADLNAAGGVKGLPKISGTFRLSNGSKTKAAMEPSPVSVAVTAAFTTEGTAVALNEVVLESDGIVPVRLSGTGRVDIRDDRTTLDLQGRRLDLTSLGGKTGERRIFERAKLFANDVLTQMPERLGRVDATVRYETIALPDDEIRNVSLRLASDEGRLVEGRMDAVLPGETSVRFSATSGVSGWFGRIDASSRTPARLLQCAETLMTVPGEILHDAKELADAPVSIASNFAFVDKTLSLNDLRADLKGGTVGGIAVYQFGDERAKAKLTTQISASGFSVAEDAAAPRFFRTMRDLDIDMAFDARNLTYGKDAKAGRISGRVISRGSELVVETLDVADLAGANAHLTGTINAEGLGHWSGTFNAKQAAPLIDLFGPSLMGGAVRLVPAFVRDQALDLRIESSQTKGDARTKTGQIRTTLSGTLAGGHFEGEAVSELGRLDKVSARLDGIIAAGTHNDLTGTENKSVPLRLTLRGNRRDDGRLGFELSGDLAGMAVATKVPFLLAETDDMLSAGEMTLDTADLTLAAGVVGFPGLKGLNVPAKADVRVSHADGRMVATFKGRLNDQEFEATFLNPFSSSISGDIGLRYASLPWIVNEFVLASGAGAEGKSGSSGLRFGNVPRLPTDGEIRIKAETIALGNGISGEDGSFKILLDDRGLQINSLTAHLDGGQLEGAFSVVRDGHMAALAGTVALRELPLASLTGGRFASNGFLSLEATFGVSAETVAGLINNLGGAGTVSLRGVTLPGLDPQALERVVAIALRDSSSLSEGRLTEIVRKELEKAAFISAPVEASMTLSGGVLKAAALRLDNSAALWTGPASFDLRTVTFDADGVLTSKSSPAGWTGSNPSIGWHVRNNSGRGWGAEVDVTTLQNGIAAIMLQREVERVDQMEAKIKAHREQVERERAEEKAKEDERKRLEQSMPASIGAERNGLPPFPNLHVLPTPGNTTPYPANP